MLEFENISVSFGGKAVLKNVSFALRPGCVTVVLGRNGSGKTTLIRAVNRQVKYSGRISLSGISLDDLSPRERAKQVGLLPQVLPQTPLTVREVVELGRNPYVSLSGKLSEADSVAVETAMADTGITGFADRPCDSLSGGERQRVFMAMLLAQNARVLLLDEPTTYLDIDAKGRLRDMMISLAHGRDCAVMAVLHDLNDAVRIADDLVILEGGRVTFAGTKEKCLAEGAIERTFAVEKFECKTDKETKVFFE